MAFTPKKGVTPDRADRMAKVLKLRRAGLHYYQIAEKLGISQTLAHKDYKQAIQEITNPIAQDIVDEHRDRIMGLITGLSAKAARGDNKAADSILKLMEYEARLLALFPKDKTQGASKAEADKYIDFIVGGAKDE
ncbi:hypothetical protein CH289_07710 [Rhodococcus sp. RS1C4]|nr:hypothetical protein [Rhodococcus sp. RS1C4]OZC55072.1 hypothetical protein CH289_07710 [Rhodococcus sp. RS1C4]